MLNRSLPPGNLRLIDAELEITIETSTKKKLSVKVHPGRAKVRDIMEQIERILGVPVREQKLYHRRTRISDEPMDGLPSGLVCSQHYPVLVVIVPEFIHVTIKEPNGKSNTVKIDKEKTLTDLLEEIPSHKNLAENEEVVFHFNGEHLHPFEHTGSLESLNIFHGSTLEVKVRITFLEINVCLQDDAEMVSVRCSPEETFSDLVKRIEAKEKKGRVKGVTFAMGEKYFDPDQEKRPLPGIHFYNQSFNHVVQM